MNWDESLLLRFSRDFCFQSCSRSTRVSLIGAYRWRDLVLKLSGGVPQDFPDNPIIFTHQRVQTGSWTIDRCHLVARLWSIIAFTGSDKPARLVCPSKGDFPRKWVARAILFDQRYYPCSQWRVEKGVLGAGWLVMTFKKDKFSPLSNDWITGSETSTVPALFFCCSVCFNGTRDCQKDDRFSTGQR